MPFNPCLKRKQSYVITRTVLDEWFIPEFSFPLSIECEDWYPQAYSSSLNIDLDFLSLSISSPLGKFSWQPAGGQALVCPLGGWALLATSQCLQDKNFSILACFQYFCVLVGYSSAPRRDPPTPGISLPHKVNSDS